MPGNVNFEKIEHNMRNLEAVNAIPLSRTARRQVLVQIGEKYEYLSQKRHKGSY